MFVFHHFSILQKLICLPIYSSTDLRCIILITMFLSLKVSSFLLSVYSYPVNFLWYDVNGIFQMKYSFPLTTFKFLMSSVFLFKLFNFLLNFLLCCFIIYHTFYFAIVKLFSLSNP